MCSKPATASNASGEPILEASDLEVVYPLPDGDVVAVKSFHLAIWQSEFVGLVGESGSGKSTSALALMALVRAPGRITSGKVRFRRNDLLAQTDDEVRAIRGREITLLVRNSRPGPYPLAAL